MKIFWLHDDPHDEFRLPQYTVWADGSFYLAWEDAHGEIQRVYAGPRFVSLPR